MDIDNGTLEDYPGPSSKVDLILLANVLSFFPKTADREIQRCLQWLNPGGHVVIILNTMNPILEATGKWNQKVIRKYTEGEPKKQIIVHVCHYW